jgi:hypothetical protein
MNRNSVFGRGVTVFAFVLAAIVVMTVSASHPAMAGGSGVCVTARIDAPFHLPDGVLYPAGALTLCDGGAYSPVDSFQRILVAGSTIGLFVSNRHNAELRSLEAPQILFTRDGDGSLSLIGYTLPSLGQSVAFRMKPVPELARGDSRPSTSDGAAPIAAIVATAR